MKSLRIVCVLAVLIIVAGASAHADTVDFEAQGVGAPGGVTLAQFLPVSVNGNTVLFSGGQLINGNPFFGFDATAIYATAFPGCRGCTLNIEIIFLVPVSNVSLQLLTPSADTSGLYLLADDNGNVTGGLGGRPAVLSLPFDNIGSLTLFTPGELTNGVLSWAFALDNLTFTTPTTVPEPGSLLLLASGLGLLVSRSRRKQSVASSTLASPTTYAQVRPLPPVLLGIRAP